MAVFKSGLQILLEYGIILERYLPLRMQQLHYSMENVYIPRIIYVISWIPIVSRYVPTSEEYEQSVLRRNGLLQPANQSQLQYPNE